jgi:hypothetical protein
MKALLTGFSDRAGIGEVFQLLYPGEGFNYVEAVGMGPGADELVLSHVEDFFAQIWSPGSPHYMLKSVTAHVKPYIRKFDVMPRAADVLKYICGFAYELENYAGRYGERELVKTMIRLNAIRLLRNASGMQHPAKAFPPDVMVRKFFNIWRHDDQDVLLGRYGTYMAFKTWSLGESMDEAPQQLQGPSAEQQTLEQAV